MCFLVDDEGDTMETGIVDPNDPGYTTSNSKRTGSKKWQCHTHHSWIIPRKVVLLIMAVGIFVLVMGILFMVIGGAIASVALRVIGGLLFGFAILALLICFLVSLHAYFYYGMKDQCTQTTETVWSDDMIMDPSGYASVGRPSALKSPDSTLKRNGTLGVKKVTMAPELGPYGTVQVSGNGHATSNTAPANLAPLHRLPASGSSSRSSTMPRAGYIDGSTVGTGGIRITPVDPNQPFPSPGSSVSYGGSAGQFYSTGGGGSLASSSTDTYAYPKSIHLNYDNAPPISPGSQSHYSTLRSIPVTHLGGGSAGSTVSASSGKQQSMKQEAVEYATVNKPVNKSGTTVVRVEHLPAQHSGSMSSSSQGLTQHVQMGQENMSSQKLIQNQMDDDGYKDYDNTVERTPMISSHQQQPSHANNMSYHEKQMNFQRHQRMPPNHQDLHAPRSINSYSLQRQYSPNPYIVQQGQEDQMQQYKMEYEQEKKLKQQQFQTQYDKSSNQSSARNSILDVVPEPAPLVYPSARRPMTFEQVSSSKMSVYDNVLANNLRESDELQG